MALFLLGFLAWLAPLIGLLLLGVGAYLGHWSWAFAVLLGGCAAALSPGRRHQGLRRWPEGALTALVMVSLGSGASALLHRWGIGVLLSLVLALAWTVVPAWVVLSLVRPAWVRRARLPEFRPRRPRHLAWTAGALMLPGVVWYESAPDISAKAHVAEELRERGLHVEEELLSLDGDDPLPKGLRSLFRRSRWLVLAAREGEPSDVFVVRVRHDHLGRPRRLERVDNLSRTAAVAEHRLSVRGSWAAWLVGDQKDQGHVELVNFAGEMGSSSWSLLQRAQNWITNLQELGQGRGVGRTSVLSNGPLAQAPDYRLSFTDVAVTTNGGSFSWPLGGVVRSTSGWDVVPLEPARPGDLTTWAVDRVRALSFVGSERLQWLKATAYRLSAAAEDVSEQIVSTDAREQIASELGDVWSRLPVVEQSPISDWPPAALELVLREPMPGEGQWIDMTHEPAFSRLTSSSLLFTFVRVDPKRPYNQVSIALWDPRRIQMHIVAGTEEPRSTLGQRGSGWIGRDPEFATRLVAAFNGGFQAIHGEFGMMEQRVVQLPPKPYAATVSTHQDGTARLGTWPGEPTPIPEGMLGLRQNMTALVAEGRPNPYARHWWGGVPEGWSDETRTVRSALCRTREGYLAYFYSPGIDPEKLTRALMLARCEYGMHLDMNGGHAGFELYRVGPRDLLPSLARPFDGMWEASGEVPELPGYRFNARLLVRQMPLMNFPRYVRRSPRDFFYLTERALLPGTAVGMLDSATWGEWKILGVPGNDFPHFSMGLALTPRGSPVRDLLRLDPRQLIDADGDPSAAVVGFHPERRRPQGASTTPSATPKAAATSRFLSFHEGRFVFDDEAGEVLLQSSPEGTVLVCLHRDGLVSIVDLKGVDDAATYERALDCQDTLRTTAAQGPLFGEQAQSAPVHLARSSGHWAASLFPETPIVPPGVWAAPQSRRAELVTSSTP